MREPVPASILIFVVAALSSLATALAIGPQLYATRAQATILSRFHQAYCAPDPQWRDDFRLGETAATSRAAIEAGLGPLAAAELVKCKLNAAASAVRNPVQK